MNQTSLTALIEMATDRRDTAASTLGTLQGEHAQAKDQLEALIEFRAEYSARLAEALSGGVSMHRLDNDQRFLAALDAAIAQQEQIVSNSANRVSEGRTDWRETQRRLQSFDTLSERKKARDAKLQLRREQAENDEAAARQSRRAVH